MAKRRPPRSDAVDATTTGARPRARRPREASDQRSVVPGPRPEALNQDAAATPTPSPQEPSEEDIRRRAYERYLERGGNHGMAFDDWVEAERELKTQKLKVKS